MNPILQHVSVFLAAAFVDALWTLYIMACAEKAAFRASVWGGLIFVISASLTLSYIENHWFMLTAGLGGMAGTYLTVRLKE
jgi:hypothetical protein